MGTNFYYRIHPKKKDLDILHEMINKLPEGDYYNIIEKLEELEAGHNIHLGKRSYGWQFLWDYHNGKLYGASLKSIKKYLQDKRGVIMNEYGEKFTIEEFLEDEIKDCLYLDDNHCNLWEYHQKHPAETLNYVISDHEFTSKDGLRFSKDENFS